MLLFLSWKKFYLLFVQDDEIFEFKLSLDENNLCNFDITQGEKVAILTCSFEYYHFNSYILKLGFILERCHVW